MEKNNAIRFFSDDSASNYSFALWLGCALCVVVETRTKHNTTVTLYRPAFIWGRIYIIIQRILVASILCFILSFFFL